MNAFIQHFASLGSFSQECLQKFADKWNILSFSKDQFLLKENDVCDYLFYTQKGICRIYYYKNEKDITEWFALDDSFFFSILSFFLRQPSKLIIQAIEPAEILCIHHDVLMELCDENHEIERLFRLMITRSLIMSQYRVDSLQFETARERYEKLLNVNPTLIQRIPLSYIASYLGITQETLSRIRSQH